MVCVSPLTLDRPKSGTNRLTKPQLNMDVWSISTLQIFPPCFCAPNTVTFTSAKPLLGDLSYNTRQGSHPSGSLEFRAVHTAGKTWWFA